MQIYYHLYLHSSVDTIFFVIDESYFVKCILSLEAVVCRKIDFSGTGFDQLHIIL